MAVIQYDDVRIERLPIDAQSVASTVHLVIAGNRAGPQPYSLMNYTIRDFPSIQPLTYAARPITYKYVLGGDIAGAARLDLKEGLDPFLPPEHEDVPEPISVVGFTNPGSPSAIRDGDPVTYAEAAGGGGIVYERSTAAKMVGFRLVYTAELGGTASVLLHPNSAVVTTRAYWDVPAATTVAEMAVLLPLDARSAPENRDGGVVIPPAPPYGVLEGVPLSAEVSVSFPGAARVTHFYPLIPNEALLEATARENVRLPATNPLRVTVAGVVPPDRTHTIEGWPGGDYTGVVAQQQYELGRTVIDFEQAGAPLGLPAEALEAARERRVAIDRAVADAAYSVRMGERL